MRNHYPFLILITLFLCLPFGNGQAQEYTDRIGQIIDGYIRPEFAEFSRSATNLPPATKALCDLPTPENKKRFTDQFGKTVQSFGSISFLRFGPLVENHTLERLAFMPDSRNIAQRQIRKELAKKDSSLFKASTLFDKSVALQGLTALQLIAFDQNGEVILDGTGDETAQMTCAYAQAIAENIQNLSTQLTEKWLDTSEAGFAQQLLASGPENPRFRSSKEAIETLFNSLITGLIIIKDQQILPALGKNLQKAKFNRMPFSRSANGIRYMAAEVKGIQSFLSAANFTPLLSNEATWIPDSAKFQFNTILDSLGSISVPVRQPSSKKDTYDKLTFINLTINGLRDTLALNLAGDLGLAGGFNALDGD